MYFIMLFTPAFYFIGMSLHIAGMVKDFRNAMAKSSEAADKLDRQQFVTQIRFHRNLFG